MHAGDRHAATEFVGEWYPRVQRWVAAATSADKIEDYTQAVFLHLAEDGWRRLFQWKGVFAEGTDNPQSLAFAVHNKQQGRSYRSACTCDR
jgi:hypothetical protein